MNVKKCDRCGKYYEYYSDPNGLKLTRSTYNNVIWCDRQIDLCEDCMFDLRCWLNGGAYDAETTLF